VTLLQAAVAVCISGCLLAAFLPTFFRQLRLSKVAEASRELERIHLAANAYFAAPHVVEGITLERCLPDPAGPTPAEPTVDAHTIEFTSEGIDHAGWRALGFEIAEPIRYSYSFTPSATGCDLRSPDGTYLLTYRAEGDLDGDGERALFERRDRARDDENLLEPTGILFVRDRTE
jgi:hypothetical protein